MAVLQQRPPPPQSQIVTPSTGRIFEEWWRWFSSVSSDIKTIGSVITGVTTTVSALPSAANSGVGARAFVTNANAATFGSIVAGGGANKVPVYSDGTNWRIG